MLNNPPQMECMRRNQKNSAATFKNILAFDGLFMSPLTFKDPFQTGAFSKTASARGIYWDANEAAWWFCCLGSGNVVKIPVSTRRQNGLSGCQYSVGDYVRVNSFLSLK